MVRLLHKDLLQMGFSFFGFNPTMVRLLRDLLKTVHELIKQFQSHNGAIAAFHCGGTV